MSFLPNSLILSKIPYHPMSSLCVTTCPSKASSGNIKLMSVTVWDVVCWLSSSRSGEKEIVTSVIPKKNTVLMIFSDESFWIFGCNTFHMVFLPKINQYKLTLPIEYLSFEAVILGKGGRDT
jgi:hypothetical protein